MVLFKKGQKLQYIKSSVLLSIMVIILFSGCGKKVDNKEQQAAFKTDDERIIEFVNNRYRCKEVKVLSGTFKPNYSLYAVVYEVNSGTEFGIKFLLAHVHTDSVIVDYNSNLFDGAVNQSVFERVNIPGKGYDAVYYNSAGYFMGSGGGEVFACLVDFQEASVVTGHVFISGDSEPKLYIPATVKEKSVRDFLVRRINNDFPGIKQVSHDVKLVD